jgi:hypothetical protein
MGDHDNFVFPKTRGSVDLSGSISKSIGGAGGGGISNPGDITVNSECYFPS